LNSLKRTKNEIFIFHGLLGGWQRGPEQCKKLEDPEIRRNIAEHIDAMKAADERAFALMKRL